MKNLLSMSSRRAGAGEKFFEALEARAYFCADLGASSSAALPSLKPAVAIHHSTKAVKLFPNYVGTFSGTVVIKKGLNKGLVFTQTVTNTSENQVTGVLTFVGTNYFSNGTTISFAG